MVREQKVILTSVVAFGVFFGVALWYLDVLCDCNDNEETKKLEERLELLGRQKHEVEQQLKEMEGRKIEAEDVVYELSKELHQAITQVTACEERMKKHDLSTKLQGELETEERLNLQDHKKQNETDQMLQYLKRAHTDLSTKLQVEQQKAKTLEGKLELLDWQKDEVEQQLKEITGRKAETDRRLQQVQRENDHLSTKLQQERQTDRRLQQVQRENDHLSTELQQERQKAYSHERKLKNKDDICISTLQLGTAVIVFVIIILCCCCGCFAMQ